MQKPTILVTGANGQLGKELRALSAAYPSFNFLFLSREDLPIHHFELVRNYFKITRPQYCVNCAAYTAVDRSETEKDLAMLINGESVGVLAAVCNDHHTKLIHISTDYVFDGEGKQPYKEDDPTEPVNYYGLTKLNGEQLCLMSDPGAIIIRTSWLYSEHGNNFVKTMIRLMKEKEQIGVVNDQVGSPTYAADLAEAIMQIIGNRKSGIGNQTSGIFHYSNKGIISWYDFAVAIKEISNSNCIIHPIPTSQYPTPAKRPHYSVLDKTKIQSTFNLQLKDWKESLRKCINKLS